MTEIKTDRLILRPFCDADQEAMLAMLADPQVMHDYPAPFDRNESVRKLRRYIEFYQHHGYGRMLVESHQRAFIGYVGIMTVSKFHIEAGCPEGVEIGMRLVRDAWGKGFATEAAKAVLLDAFSREGFKTVWAFANASNLKWQSVIRKLGMIRRPSFDYAYSVDNFSQTNLVFSVDREDFLKTDAPGS